MLSADPPHAFAMRALPSAMSNLVAYLFGWGRRQGLLRRDDDDEGEDDDDDAQQSNDNHTNDGNRNRDSGTLGRRVRVRSRDVIGRTAFYRVLARGPMVDAERMIESTMTPHDFMALVGDPLALSTAVAGDRVAAVLLVGRHAARLGIDPHALFGDVHLCDTRAGGHATAGALGAHRVSLVHLACATDSVAVLALLLRMGVDPQHRCASTRAEAARADTPLHVAARAGARACVAVLLGAGASPNAEARDGMTPLHEAAGNGHTDVARLLLAWGASTTARRRHDGATASGVATHSGYPATAAAISIIGDVRHCARDAD
ncbi:Ankyrin repeat domain containing protein [Pandoravirus macleodensis]|uniref:Ankyrin repeat domain containing protein n=1 Tax=Pandoravirus macleodensis TaxID=2107707 RepID=A0A2U7UEE0_9VIRU|nr:Ankyrin repeat domain containing protein [Pandoravirus macleodensis]AVK76804.1 Ankyrin repeat domain containing protein [Pandoravirus macleodensis]UMO79375.1 Ankyrin repeat domain containing protein [Pandoravirus aubagnensis]